MNTRRVCVLAWGGAAVSWELSTPGRLVPSLATCAAFLLLATGCALHIRRELLAELRRSQEIAGAAQRALLRPLPGRIDGLTLAAAQLSASRGAAVGGDLYEAVPTAYGIRLVIGDVRGHGLPALGAAAAVLGAFREAAYDEVALDGVLRRMERALGRYLRDRARSEHPSSCPAEPESPTAEEFVTVLLLQIAPDGTLTALNCGHPWPYLLSPDPVPEPCAVRGAAPAPQASGPTVRAEPGTGPARRPTRVRALDGAIRCRRSGCCPYRWTYGRTPAVNCCPGRRCSCTPTAPRRPATPPVCSSPCGASSPRRRPRPRGWSRACTRPCSGIPAGGSPTTSPCWSSATTVPDRPDDRGPGPMAGADGRDRWPWAGPPGPGDQPGAGGTGARRPPAMECRADSRTGGAVTGRRTVRGGADDPSYLLARPLSEARAAPRAAECASHLCAYSFHTPCELNALHHA